jgi:hypothetical protein
MSKRIPSQRRGLLVGVVLVVVVIAVAAGANLAMGSGTNVANGPDGPVVTLTPLATGSPITDWPKNAAGLTYGSEALAKSSWDAPDLISAVATNGKSGYVYKEDMQWNPPTLEDIKAAPSKTWLVAVYELDGVTQVGVIRTGWAPASDTEPSE